MEELNGEDKKEFEIIFVSLDGDEPAFERNYMGVEEDKRDQMHCLAVPYKDEQLRKDLQQRYGVSVLPTIAIVDMKGTMIECEGEKEASNPETAMESL